MLDVRLFLLRVSIAAAGTENFLLVLGGTVPISYREVTYNIPVEIAVSLPFPYAAPLCFVRPVKGMEVLPILPPGPQPRSIKGIGVLSPRLKLPFLTLRFLPLLLLLLCARARADDDDTRRSNGSTGAWRWTGG